MYNKLIFNIMLILYLYSTDALNREHALLCAPGLFPSHFTKEEIDELRTSDEYTNL